MAKIVMSSRSPVLADYLFAKHWNELVGDMAPPRQ
jgi:hypothetical protein